MSDTNCGSFNRLIHLGVFKRVNGCLPRVLPAMITCEPGQARKGATLASDSCAGVWLWGNLQSVRLEFQSTYYFQQILHSELMGIPLSNACIMHLMADNTL